MKLKDRGTVWFIGNAFLAAGAGLALYYLASLLLLQRNLPAGACPFDANRPLLYIALAFVLASFVLSFFEKKKPRKE